LKPAIKKYGRQLILSFYLAWYLYIVITNFDPCLQIWVNALVISLIVGVALNASVGSTKQNVSQRIRLFAIPFAVSSYTGLIRGKDFVMIFPPSWQETIVGLILSLIVAAGYFLYLVKNKG